jgi:tight adherence protein B
VPVHPENPADLVIMLAAFLLVLSLWGVLVWGWALHRASQVRDVEERLGLWDPEPGPKHVLRLWHDGREVTTAVPIQSHRLSFRTRLNQVREHAGWEIPLRSVILGLAGVVSLAFLLTMVLGGGILAAIAIVAIILMAFWTYVKQRMSRREALFERQLIDALDLAARSLRAGHPLAGAFRLASEEIPPPVGTAFAEVCQQEHLGVSFGDALKRVTARCPSADMRLLATSVGIQLRSGGNLADMMDRLVAVMRDRIRLHRRARILTAQTQFSKRVLIILPFAIFVLLSVVRPGYMEPMYSTSLGRILLVTAAVSLLFGAWIMNRMAALRY